jgi:hypothetical protein
MMLILRRSRGVLPRPEYTTDKGKGGGVFLVGVVATT